MERSTDPRVSRLTAAFIPLRSAAFRCVPLRSAVCVAHVHALPRRAEHSARLQYPTDRPLLLTQAGDHAHGYVGDHSHGLIEKDPTPLAELEETV